MLDMSGNPGRPAVPEAEKKRPRAYSASDADEKKILRAAKLAGKTKATWVRETLLAAAERIIKKNSRNG